MKHVLRKPTSIKSRRRDSDSVSETPADLSAKESLKECLRQAIEDEREVIVRYLGNASRKILRKKPPKSAKQHRVAEQGQLFK